MVGRHAGFIAAGPGQGLIEAESSGRDASCNVKLLDIGPYLPDHFGAPCRDDRVCGCHTIDTEVEQD
jgi:hypothetical protein